MADMLLDTRLIQDYRTGDPGAGSIIQQVVEGVITASVSPLTVFELLRSTKLDRRVEVEYVSILSFLEMAPLTAEAAKSAGVWMASFTENEQDNLGQFSLIAATAKERGEAVCTRNSEAFGRFKVEIVGY